MHKRFPRFHFGPFGGSFFALVMLVSTVAAQTPPADSSRIDETVEALLRRGDALYAAFDNNSALDSYKSAYTRAPDRFDVLLRLTRAYHDLAKDLLAAGSKKAAEEAIRKAVAVAEEMKEKFPDRPETYFQLAAAYGNLALFKGGKSKVKIGRDVEQYAKKAIELDSTYAPAYVALGLFYREVSDLNWIQRSFAKVLFGGVPSGSKEDAAAMLERAIALNPDFALAHFELAITYEKMGRKEDAIPHLRKAIELPPATSQDVRNREIARKLIEKWTK
ncbi:tetratricopeptide repeat protein [Rhodocaloribacter sp.]